MAGPSNAGQGQRTGGSKAYNSDELSREVPADEKLDYDLKLSNLSQKLGIEQVQHIEDSPTSSKAMPPAPLSDLLPPGMELPPATWYRRDSIIANAMYRRNSVGADDRNPTYHDDEQSQYSLPNDFQEHIRLEAQAVHLLAMMNDRVIHAPVRDATGKRMLDVGCGTGIVTDLIADAYPNAECIGLDLSEVPSLRPHARNTRFFQGNVITQIARQWRPSDDGPTLTQDYNLFDYIFSRLLVFGIINWPGFMKQHFDLLKPGGWTEVHDLDWDWYDRNNQVISTDWPWLRTLSREYEDKNGLDFHCGSRAQQWMRDAGFVDVQVFRYHWPFGGQSESTVEVREFAEFTNLAFPSMMHHMIARTMSDDPLSEDRRDLIERMRADMRWCVQPEPGKYLILYVTIGRRPE